MAICPDDDAMMMKLCYAIDASMSDLVLAALMLA